MSQITDSQYKCIPFSREILPYLSSVEGLNTFLGSNIANLSWYFDDLEINTNYGESFIKGAEFLCAMTNAGKYTLLDLKNALFKSSGAGHVISALAESAAKLYSMDRKQIDAYNFDLVNGNIIHLNYKKTMDSFLNEPIQDFHLKIFEDVKSLTQKLGSCLPLIECYNGAFNVVEDITIREIQHSGLPSNMEKGRMLLIKMVEYNRLTLKGFIRLLFNLNQSGLIIGDLMIALDKQSSFLESKIQEKPSVSNNRNLQEEREIQSLKRRLQVAEFESQKAAVEIVRLQDAEESQMNRGKSEMNREKSQSNEAKSQMNKEKSECVVCMDTEPDVAFANCGHVCCCHTCAEKLNTCPMCKGHIAKKIKIFKS